VKFKRVAFIPKYTSVSLTVKQGIAVSAKGSLNCMGFQIRVSKLNLCTKSMGNPSDIPP
jgi:hypothetical protein